MITLCLYTLCGVQAQLICGVISHFLPLTPKISFSLDDFLSVLDVDAVRRVLDRSAL